LVVVFEPSLLVVVTVPLPVTVTWAVTSMLKENSVASWLAQACRLLALMNCPSQNSAPLLVWQLVVQVLTVSVSQVV